ncbi:tetratricopeptide repeat protein [Methyloceanibacter superfactus]|nr:tetratricopeptide repeat protein [Methyloceanibacter superfactus]
MRQGDLDEALTAFREGLAVAENLAEADPHNADWQRSLSDSFNSIGEALMAQGKLGDALEYFHKGLAVSDRLAEAHPNHPDAQAGLATSHANIGLVLMLRGEAASARQSLREARLVVVRLKDQGTDVTSILELYEAALSKLEAVAMSLEEKDAGAAGDALQQARDLFAKIKELSPGDDAFLARLDAAIVNLRKTIAAEPDVADPTPSAD